MNNSIEHIRRQRKNFCFRNMKDSLERAKKMLKIGDKHLALEFTKNYFMWKRHYER